MRTIGVVAAFLFSSSSLLASTYELQTVKDPLGLAESDLEALKKQGVSTTAQLLDRAGTKRAIGELAKATGIPRDKIATWAGACDLMRISGIGPEVVKLLAAVGVKDSRHLAKQGADKLSRKIEQANEKQKLSEKTPSPEHLAAWIKAAADLLTPGPTPKSAPK